MSAVPLIVIFILFLAVNFVPCFAIFGQYFDCSDEYFADFDLYGACIAQKCGRFSLQLEEIDVNLVETVSNYIYYQDDIRASAENTTIIVADLTSDKVTKDQVTTIIQSRNKQYQRLTEELLETVGYKIRGFTQELFDLNAPLWISR
jgi:hypothetical protein